MYYAALDVLELADQVQTGFLAIGAERMLGHGIYRQVGDDPHRVCPPSDLYARAQRSPEVRNSFRAYLERYQFDLAARFPDPPPHIVDAIAAVAFSDTPHPGREQYGPNPDLRPVARVILAGYGKQAARYLPVARGQVSAKDSLGTGAAQVSAAVGDASDLARIESLMADALARIPVERTLKIEERDRLYELAYALAIAKERARPHVAPIKDLMRRKVGSNATFFGVVELQPKQMCLVLEAIEGASSVKGYGYCRDEVYPYPQ